MPNVTLENTGVFTGYDLDNLRALCLRMLRVSNTVRFSPTSGTADYDWIDDSLNRGQEEFVRRTNCLRTYAIIELLASQRTYRLPDDFLDLMAAYFYDDSLTDGYKELSVKTIEELNDDISDWRTDTGTPKYFYIDRNFGAGITFGLSPIPDTNGDTITFSSNYGVAVTWVCPLYTFNQDIGAIIRITGADEWILPTQDGVSVDAQPSNKNLLIEYYRLPQILVEQGAIGTQKTEIPREYQKSLVYYAVSDLLQNNPEDAAEFKRSAFFIQEFEKEVQTYINRRKRALAARQLQAKPHVWSWRDSMTSFNQLA